MHKNIGEEAGKFADSLCDGITKTGVSTNLDDPHKAFLSGTYFGASQGYVAGINKMLAIASDNLPDIFNEIVKSGYDMTINWPDRFRKLIIKNYYGE